MVLIMSEDETLKQAKECLTRCSSVLPTLRADIEEAYTFSLFTFPLQLRVKNLVKWTRRPASLSLCGAPVSTRPLHLLRGVRFSRMQYVV